MFIMKKQNKLSLPTYVAMLATCAVLSCGKTNTPAPSTPVVVPPVNTVKAYTPDGWKALESFISPRLCATAVTINEKIYAGLGYSGSSGYGSLSNDWNEYDPATSKWTAKAAFPGSERANAVGFVVNGKVYVGLGTNYNRAIKGDVYRDFYEYDPATDKWTKKADFTGSGRDQPVYFSIGNKGYVGTGNSDPFDAATVLSDFWEYDPATDKWTQKADLKGTARCRAFGFALGGKGYAGGGEDRNVMKQKDCYEYDPLKNEWTAKADYPELVSRARGFSFGDFGYLTGGIITANDKTSEVVYKYNPKDNTWTKSSDLAVEDDSRKGRFYQIAVATKTKAYIGLGANGSGTSPANQKDFYEYVPK